MLTIRDRNILKNKKFFKERIKHEFFAFLVPDGDEASVKSQYKVQVFHHTRGFLFVNAYKVMRAINHDDIFLRFKDAYDISIENNLHTFTCKRCGDKIQFESAHEAKKFKNCQQTRMIRNPYPCDKCSNEYEQKYNKYELNEIVNNKKILNFKIKGTTSVYYDFKCLKCGSVHHKFKESIFDNWTEYCPNCNPNKEKFIQ